jgi:hypothetical protein
VFNLIIILFLNLVVITLFEIFQYKFHLSGILKIFSYCVGIFLIDGIKILLSNSNNVSKINNPYFEIAGIGWTMMGSGTTNSALSVLFARLGSIVSENALALLLIKPS